MAISPIDLQTLFTQMDKVGKQEIVQKEGAAITQALQNAQNQRVTEEKIRSVNEAQNQGEGAEGVRDKNGRKAPNNGFSRKNKKDTGEADQAEKKYNIIRDPDLGSNIDLSL